jgi:NAD(P)-dependent dehydrogenase (short-subunit alcohol dehydrogenase family)
MNFIMKPAGLCGKRPGVLSSAARFAGYNASKAALEAFTRCAAAE